MVWQFVFRALTAGRVVAVGGTAGTGYVVKKKIDEIEEATGLKLERARKFFEELEEGINEVGESTAAKRADLQNLLSGWLKVDPVAPKEILVNTSAGEQKMSIEDAANLAAETMHQTAQPVQDSTTSDAPEDIVNFALIKDLEQQKTELDKRADQAIMMKTELALIQGELGAAKQYSSKLENKNLELSKRIEQLEKSALDVELKYQKTISRLEQDVTDLRRQLLFERENRNKRGKGLKKIKRQLVDIYSDVLDTLSTSGYSANDQLPRIVVVGDQSAGKTSVLESIAKARLFPRGQGQMMTKSPVKVTLCEGPRMEAYFPDTPDKIFNLTKPTEEAALRSEIQRRMEGACQRTGQTVSELPVNVTVSGPGLRRMVLVDLPGVISTVTNEMHPDTKKAIEGMVRSQLANPNAIILCIQDGSVDAERSIVTDLVSGIDPKGSRTMFVLTKVDKAEAMGTDKNRVKKILDGKLFPMKALGYHAVVTGRGEGSAEDSIDQIRDYEEKFFADSQLFHSGLLKPSQLTTQNLANAVSDLFWKMIRETIEQQSDAFKAARFNLETEWKNNFPRVRELDRTELFEKAKNEILDQVLGLPTSIKPAEWQHDLLTRLWEHTSHHVVEQIFIPSANKAESSANFNTMIDIKLRQWADRMLPQLATKVAREILLERFSKIIAPGVKTKAFAPADDATGSDQDKRERQFQAIMDSKSDKKLDPIFDLLREELLQESIRRHKWDEEYYQTLRVIQLNALDDRVVSSKEEWLGAIKFIQENLGKKKRQTDEKLKEMIGPNTLERYMSWIWLTSEQIRNRAIYYELTAYLPIKMRDSLPNQMSSEEVLTLRKQLELKNPSIKFGTNAREADDNIRAIWYQLYRREFLTNSMKRTGFCKGQWYRYNYSQTDKGAREKEVFTADAKGLHEFDEVLLFWRIQKMLEATSNALRQQVMNSEARRLEKHVGEVLDDIGDNYDQMETLLVGRRVTLAEELKKVREVQNLLDEFIAELRRESG